MVLEKSQLALMRELFRSSDGLALYSVFSRLAWSPAMLASEVSKAERAGLISVNSDRLQLTSKGRMDFLSVYPNKTLSKDACERPSLKKWFLRIDALEINMPYVPRRKARR